MKNERVQRAMILGVPILLLAALVGCPSIGSGSGGGGNTNQNDNTSDGVCGAGVLGPTTHTGSDITSDTTWTAAASPHIVTGSLTIRNGATLTIEPCVNVQLDAGVQIRAGLSSLDDPGTLIALGTADEPITFSASMTDRWKNLLVQHPGSAQLANVTFTDGGSDETTYDGATLVVWGDSNASLKKIIDVNNVTISGSAGYGMLLDRWGAFTDASTGLTITGSGATLAEFPYPVHADVQLLGSLPPGTYTGNATDEFFVSPRGGVIEDMTLQNLGIPYHIDGVGSTMLTVDKGATLTVEAGVTVRFDAELSFKFSSNITAGVLHAMGQPGNPVVFTSAASAPQAGDWRGITFRAAPPAGMSNMLNNVRIEYAGGDCSCGGWACFGNQPEDSAILIFDWEPAASFLTNSTISDCAGHGILRGWEDFTCGSPLDMTATNTFTNVVGCEQTVPVPAPSVCQDGCPAVTCP